MGINVCPVHCYLETNRRVPTKASLVTLSGPISCSCYYLGLDWLSLSGRGKEERKGGTKRKKKFNCTYKDKFFLNRQFLGTLLHFKVLP